LSTRYGDLSVFPIFQEMAKKLEEKNADVTADLKENRTTIHKEVKKALLGMNKSVDKKKESVSLK